jgi:hypothetical protein
MGLAAPLRTAQDIYRAETHCTSQGTGTPFTNAEVVVVVVVVVEVVAAVIVVVQKTSSCKHELFTFTY